MRLLLRVNGTTGEVEGRSDEMLVHVLRRELGLTSVRETCGIGVCGTCTVLVDGETSSACLLLAPLAVGREITTVEGLGGEHPVQRAFARAHAFQCGYCTPGMILAGVGLLRANPEPGDPEIVRAMEGNICRCGTYPRILAAIRRAAGAMKGGDR